MAKKIRFKFNNASVIIDIDEVALLVREGRKLTFIFRGTSNTYNCEQETYEIAAEIEREFMKRYGIDE